MLWGFFGFFYCRYKQWLQFSKSQPVKHKGLENGIPLKCRLGGNIRAVILQYEQSKQSQDLFLKKKVLVDLLLFSFCFVSSVARERDSVFANTLTSFSPNRSSTQTVNRPRQAPEI